MRFSVPIFMFELPLGLVQVAPISPVCAVSRVPFVPVKESDDVSVDEASPSRQWLSSPAVALTAPA